MSIAQSATYCPPSSTDHNNLIRICEMLSIPVRLRIVMLLAEGERNVKTLGQQLNAPQPTVSHHLGLLHTSGVVEHRRAGREVFYRLRDVPAENAGMTLKVSDHQFRFTVGPAASPVG